MTSIEAMGKARSLWTGVVGVSQYTLPEWRCKGWRGWRVVVAGSVIHWMTKKGKPQCTCCRADTKRDPNRAAGHVASTTGDSE